MANDAITPGDVLLITLPMNTPKGHEQEGNRPVIVVGVPTGPTRYPVVIVIPLTTQSGPWTKKNPALCQRLPRGAGGLFRNTITLIDQVRAVDVRRVKAYLGSLEPEAFEPIRSSLLQLFQREVQG